MDYIKVKGHENLIRDPITNSIINTNMSEYKEYIYRKNFKIEEDQKIQNLENDMNNIKSDLSEIKYLLRNLTNESR
jgi:hypothetical protein